MAGFRIPGLPPMAPPELAANDLLVVYDADADETKSVPAGAFSDPVSTKANASAVGITAADTDMGDFTADFLPDGITAKAALDLLGTGFDALASDPGAGMVGFLQAGAGAVLRSALSKMREVVTPEDYGAVGDGVTDDTQAFLDAFDHLAILGGGTLRSPGGRIYRTTAQLMPPSGVSVDLNWSMVEAHISTPNECAFQIQSNCTLERGHIKVVQEIAVPGVQAGALCPVRVGNLYGMAGTPAAPTPGEFASGWTLRDLIVESDKRVETTPGSGQYVGSAGIQIVGGAHHGVIDHITVPDSTRMSSGIGLDWGFLGNLSSTDTFANMTANRAAFEAGSAYTTHPHNISISNVKIGRMTLAATGAVDVGSFGIRASGCYNLSFFNVGIEQVTYVAVANTAGDLGFEYAPTNVKPFACQNLRYSNIVIQSLGTAVGVQSDSDADNVRRASRIAEFTGSIAGAVLTVTAIASGAIAVGHTVYAGERKVGTVSAFGTGAGGVGTYTLTGATNTASTAMGSGYNWIIFPTYESNVLFEDIVGRGPADATADYGMRFQYQRGGTARRCNFSGCFYGCNVDEAGARILFDKCNFSGNRRDGMYVEHGGAPPDGIVIVDLVAERNGQDTVGYPVSSGLLVGVSRGVKIIRGEFGTKGDFDPSQRVGLRVIDGALNTDVDSPTIRSARAVDGFGMILLSGEGFNQLWRCVGVRWEPGFVITKYGGLTCIPVSREFSAAGALVTRYRADSGAGLSVGATPLQVLVGDRIEWTNPVAANPYAVVCTTAGTVGAGAVLTNWS